MTQFEAGNWPEFLDAVRTARRELNDPSVVWYRGRSKTGHSLVPSLLRDIRGLAAEGSIFDDYERLASHLLPPRANDWEMLIDMQHYFIPTRLLDWTDVLGVAIAFSLFGSEDGEDPALLVLDPNALNTLSGVTPLRRPGKDPDFEYKKIYWHGQPFSPDRPLAVDCVLNNPRLRAQSGTFTIHGRNVGALEEQVPEVVRKIILKRARSGRRRNSSTTRT